MARYRHYYNPSLSILSRFKHSAAVHTRAADSRVVPLLQLCQLARPPPHSTPPGWPCPGIPRAVRLAGCVCGSVSGFSRLIACRRLPWHSVLIVTECRVLCLGVVPRSISLSSSSWSGRGLLAASGMPLSARLASSPTATEYHHDFSCQPLDPAPSIGAGRDEQSSSPNSHSLQMLLYPRTGRVNPQLGSLPCIREAVGSQQLGHGAICG